MIIILFRGIVQLTEIYILPEATVNGYLFFIVFALCIELKNCRKTLPLSIMHTNHDTHICIEKDI